MEGEGKSKEHDMGSGANGTSIPTRRWEDWERSRLRKIKREEKRRRDLARAFPNGYNTKEYLRVGDTISQYDGSDTVSMASSEEDKWGPSIGTYNEDSSQFPPPPNILMPDQGIINAAETVGGDQMVAMLEAGFDDRPSRPGSGYSTPFSSSTTGLLDPNVMPNTPRYQLSDTPSPPRAYPAYPQAMHRDGPRPPPRHVTSPVSPTIPVNASSSAVDSWKTHAKKRSGGRGDNGSPQYGPLGPLDPGDGAF